jgi:ribose transport system substrate-binding protein
MSTKPRVLLSLLTEHEEYQKMQAESARAAATRAGIELEVVYSGNDPAVQLKQVLQRVGEAEGSRPKAIIVEAAATTGFESAARAAVQAGIGWILVSDRVDYLDVLRREFPNRLVSCVYVVNEDVGQMQGRIFRALLPAGGAVLCVEGPSLNSAAVNRRRGLEQALQGSPIRIIASVSADWTAGDAERVFSSWLRQASGGGARPNLIGVQNDEMATGVRKAIAALRPEWADIPLTGCDGLPERGQKLVKEGVLAATIVVPPRGGIAVETVAKFLRRQPVPPFGAVAPYVYPKLETLAAAAAARAGSPPAT